MFAAFVEGWGGGGVVCCLFSCVCGLWGWHKFLYMGGMKLTNDSRASVQDVWYDDEQKTLRLVIYNDGTYEYYGVHDSLYTALMAAERKEDYLQRVILPAGFRSSKVAAN